MKGFVIGFLADKYCLIFPVLRSVHIVTATHHRLIQPDLSFYSLGKHELEGCCSTSTQKSTRLSASSASEPPCIKKKSKCHPDNRKKRRTAGLQNPNRKAEELMS